MVWEKIDRHRTLQLLQHKRSDVGGAARLITGHNRLNKHAHLLKESDSDLCRWCLTGPESSEHIMCHCPSEAFLSLRQSCTGQLTLTPDELKNLPVKHIMEFVKLLSVLTEEEVDDEGNDDELPSQNPPTPGSTHNE